MRTCLNCGATGIPDDALVCSCGGNLVDRTAPEAANNLVPPEIDAWWPQDTTWRRVPRYAAAVAVAGLLAIGVVVSSRADFDALIVPPSASTPSAEAVETSTTVADVDTTTAPTTTTTSTTSAVATELTPPPSVVLPIESTPPVPSAITVLLGVTGTLDHDDFSSDSDRWELAGFAGRWETLPDRIVVGTRTSTAGGGVLSNFAVMPGTAVVLRVSYSVRTAAKAFLDSGAVGDSGYRRFGLRMGADWHADAVVSEHYLGAAELTELAPVGDLVPRPGQEYYLILAVEENGTLGFGVLATDGDTYAIEIRDYGDLWANRAWRMHAGVDEGILNIFEFWLVEFSSIG